MTPDEFDDGVDEFSKIADSSPSITMRGLVVCFASVVVSGALLLAASRSTLRNIRSTPPHQSFITISVLLVVSVVVIFSTGIVYGALKDGDGIA